MHLLSASFASSDGARLRRYIVHGIVQLRRARDIATDRPCRTRYSVTVGAMLLVGARSLPLCC